MYVKKILYLFIALVMILLSNGMSYDGREKQYDEIINRAACENGLDPALIKAVIKAESDFNNMCFSPKGACGLMQVMPDTARIVSRRLNSQESSYEISDIMSPEKNILIGSRYLKDMIYLFNGNIVKALAAYNAGPSVVKKYNGIPPYKETRDYIHKVITHKNRYSGGSSKSKIYYYTAPDGSVVFFNR